MCVSLNSVALILAVLISCPESETAIVTAFITESSSPSYALEGYNLTLVWTYTLDGTVGLAQFSIITANGTELRIGRKFGPGVVTVEAKYQARFRAQTTNTRAELSILAVQRSDETTYRMNVVPTGTGGLVQLVVVIVSRLPNITEISGNQTVIEGGNVTLICSAVGKPEPNIAWTRLSDNSAVSMPLTAIRRQDAGKYRCTADNGIGSPAFGDLWIDVQYKPDDVSLNISANKVCSGMAVTFTCSAGDANPPIQNNTLHDIGTGHRYTSSNQVGVFEQTLHTEGLHRYICKASNSVGNTSSEIGSVEVQVTGSVKIAKSKVVVSEGANVIVHCNFSGFNSQHVSWINASNYIVETGSTLKFSNIRRCYDGEYNCSASNACGVDSKRVYIGVRYPAEASGKGQNYVLDKGNSVSFKCPVAGNPEPNITWYNSSRVPISFEKELEARESGCYTCVADNSLGKSISIRQCLTIRTGTSSSATPSATHTPTPSITGSRGKETAAKVTIIGVNYTKDFEDLNSNRAKRFVAEFVEEMDNIYKIFPEYNRSEVTDVRPGSVIVYFILHFLTAVTPEKGLGILEAAISFNGTFGRYKAKDLVHLSEESTTSTASGPHKPTAGPPWAIIGAVAGGVVLLAILVGVLTWWVHKQRKCRKETKVHNSDLGRHDDEGGYWQVRGAYAQSGPPAANGADGTAEQEIEVAGAIPTYAVVDKSKSKKQADKNPPEYAVVDKSKEKEKQEAAAIPTYAAVDKSKNKKKLREEVPAVYAEVDKSKKKKKKIDDKNLYETLDEPKKEKKPGELLYADLGDFQNPRMPTVSISPQPLPAIKKADPYERTDYADITQFLKGNATLPPNDGNGDTEMKPKRPSKKNIQGNDKETPI